MPDSMPQTSLVGHQRAKELRDGGVGLSEKITVSGFLSDDFCEFK